MQTQWRSETVVAGRNVVTLRHGLDYSGLGPIAAGFAIALSEDVMDKLRALEAQGLAIHAKRQRAALRRS